VETAIGKATRYGWSGQFFISAEQLETEKVPDLFYVLALRRGTQWEFIIVSRLELNEEYMHQNVGTLNKDVITFTLRFHNKNVLCSTRSFQRYRNNWATWPTL
jgi:hypothetical protein